MGRDGPQVQGQAARSAGGGPVPFAERPWAEMAARLACRLVFSCQESQETLPCPTPEQASGQD